MPRIQRALRELFRSDERANRPPANLRREDDYPPGYPTGWYSLAKSTQLASHRPIAVSCLGRDFVIFKGQDSGTLCVADAHCPHQGANLAVGGTVSGDCVRCPFHAWEFHAEGDVRVIPGVEKLPPIRLGRWPAVERFGLIWIYFDASNPRCAPAYPLAEYEEIDDGRLVHRGDYSPDDVHMHLIEFAENSVDFQHFAPLHGKMLLPWTRMAVPFTTVKHEASWELDEERDYISYFNNLATVKVFDKELPRSAASARITFYGPGGLIWFRFSIPDMGDILLFHTHTPLAPLQQRVHFRWYAEPKIPRLLVLYVVGSWISNWRADIDVWENKVYRRKPMLSRVDGPVSRMRRWYSQFYPEEETSSSR